jgi:hypothetical protein
VPTDPADLRRELDIAHERSRLDPRRHDRPQLRRRR